MDFDRNLPAAADDDLGTEGDLSPALVNPEAPVAPQAESTTPAEGGVPPKAQVDPEAEATAPAEGAPRKRKRRFNSPRASNAHLQRIEDYRALVEKRGWIFAPPSPPLPLSALLTHLTGKQIESLAG